jgi:hypothetical protein
MTSLLISSPNENLNPPRIKTLSLISANRDSVLKRNRPDTFSTEIFPHPLLFRSEASIKLTKATISLKFRSTQQIIFLAKKICTTLQRLISMLFSLPVTFPRVPFKTLVTVSIEAW